MHKSCMSRLQAGFATTTMIGYSYRFRTGVVFDVFDVFGLAVAVSFAALCRREIVAHGVICLGRQYSNAMMGEDKGREAMV